jgi:hypothetical protein
MKSGHGGSDGNIERGCQFRKTAIQARFRKAGTAWHANASSEAG